MDAAPDEATLACTNAIPSLGWQVGAVQPDSIEGLFKSPGGEWVRITAVLTRAASGGTAVTLNGWFQNKAGPLMKKKLRGWMDQFQAAISANVGGTYIRDCTLLGGHGHGIGHGARCSVEFRGDQLLIEPVEGERACFDCKDIELFDIGGKGLVTSGGGFSGGGFGAEGALLGMGVASVLNRLTTSKGIDTVVHIQARDREAWLQYPHETPDALRMRLAAALAAIDGARREAQGATPRATSVTDELARLSELHSQGVLTANEYTAAKARLIERL